MTKISLQGPSGTTGPSGYVEALHTIPLIGPNGPLVGPNGRIGSNGARITGLSGMAEPPTFDSHTADSNEATVAPSGLAEPTDSAAVAVNGPIGRAGPSSVGTGTMMTGPAGATESHAAESVAGPTGSNGPTTMDAATANPDTSIAAAAPTTDRPAAPKPNFNGIPAELQKLPNWVMWRYLPPKKPGQKWRKVPFQVNGQPADSTRRSTWNTFEACCAACERGQFDGIGFCFDETVGPDGFCYVGIDFDSCFVNDVVLPPAQERIKKLGTYTEYSVSGTGMHCIARGKPLERRAKAEMETDNPFGIEIYSTRRYFTFTGYGHGQIRAAAAEVDTLVAEVRVAEAHATDAAKKTGATSGNGKLGKLPAGFEYLDPNEDITQGIKRDYWYDQLPPKLKDEVLDYVLGIIASKTKFLELEENGGNNDMYFTVATAVSRCEAPHTYDIWIKYAGAVEGADDDDTLLNTLDRCEKQPSSKYQGITVGTLLYLGREHGANYDKWRQQAREQETKQPPPGNKLFQSSAEFVAGYVPPDYLIDGLLQRRYVYSFTAKTGDGKTTIALLLAAHVARGIMLAGHEVEKGRVLIFAGENPDDVRSRWIMLCEVLEVDPDQMDVVFMPWTLNLSAEAIRAQIDAEAAKAGPFSLLIVDTSASYYSGDDENDNVKLGAHARMLRSFVDLPGGPTILVTCHPTKNPDMANLLPRGGGAFLAEVDGNLVAIKDATTMLVEVTWHGKFRGPDFPPFSFKLIPSTSPKLVDGRGRSVWSIYAQVASKAEQEQLEKNQRVEQGLVLQVMLAYPEYSLTDIAEYLGWSSARGEPSKQKVHRLMMKLQKAKLVEQGLGGGYKLTTRGQTVAKGMPRLPPTTQ